MPEERLCWLIVRFIVFEASIATDWSICRLVGGVFGALFIELGGRFEGKFIALLASIAAVWSIGAIELTVFWNGTFPGFDCCIGTLPGPIIEVFGKA